MVEMESFITDDRLKTLKDYPEDVQDEIGYALQLVQNGTTPRSAKPLKGYRGAQVLEVVENYDSDTYRAV